jgi:hypothetical protein
VSVWSLKSRSSVSHFRTGLDYLPYGGLGITVVEEPIVIVASNRHGLCGYDGLTGERIWNDSSRRSLAFIWPFPDDDAFAVDPARKPVTAISSLNGETLTSWRGVQFSYASPFSNLVLHCKAGKAMLRGWPDDIPHWPKWKPGTFFNVAFSPDAIAYPVVEHFGSDLLHGAPRPFSPNRRRMLSCIDFYGDHLWDWDPPVEHAVSDVVWNQESRCWVCFHAQWYYGTDPTMSVVDADGNLIRQIPMENRFWFFSMGQGRFWIRPNGEVRSLPENELVWRFTEAE